MNLHHFLYDMAVHPDKWASAGRAAVPTPAERETLNAAIAFYRTQYAKLPIRDDPTLIGIKRALSVDDAERRARARALPSGLAAVLAQASPVYARYFWPAHDASNRRWIACAAALDMQYGAEVQAAIERHLEARFPQAAIRVDIVFDTGSRQGAYTDKQSVIPSGRVDYQDRAALEMLYHEASHTTVTDPLEQAIARYLQLTKRDGDSDLWHVAQFYTVGAVTREVLARHGEQGYVPYADMRGLYSGYWAPLMPAIDTAWRAHLAGKTSLDEAARQMVHQLPPAKR